MTALTARFRTCQVTGLKVDRAADLLILVNGVTAVLWLAAGGVMALLISLTRAGMVSWIPTSEWFYRILGAHGAAMLIFWILFFEVAGLIFGGSVLLSQPLRAPKVFWLSYIMMLGGSLGASFLMLSGRATVMFTAYPPLEASSWFYFSILVFAVGSLIAVFAFIGNVVAARLSGAVRTLPLFTFALVTAAILAVFTLASGAAALIPAWLWSLGLIDNVDPGVYRLLFWGFGHGAQQVNLAAMVGIWYALASLTTGAKPLNEGLSRFAFLLYLFFIQMGSIHHILVDPGLSDWGRGLNTSYFVYAAVLGSMIHAFTIPAAVEGAQRRKGITGLFGWLRKAPWGAPGFSAFAISFAMFGILGGISGVIIGGKQVNMMVHNTLTIPAHFHMTVVAGTTLSFMGISYYLLPLIARRDLFLPQLAKIQPYMYGLGMAFFGAGMTAVGQNGVPRRHWDITFGGAPLANGIFDTPIIERGFLLMAIGAVIAITAGAIFVIVAAGTVFISKRSDTPNLVHVDPEALSGSETVAHHGKGFEAPGTFALVTVWILIFMLLYARAFLILGNMPWEVS